MDYRLLGQTGVQVSSLCFGTMSFGGDADEDGLCAVDVIGGGVEWVFAGAFKDIFEQAEVSAAVAAFALWDFDFLA